ncbi:G5 domain-containing protein [Candidatus Parcubacteria bacterium]|nr:G5 domain-containing protein [Candidatus Parcubacteria bacterium]
MLGVWLSKHAHRRIEVPVLRYLAIAAIMLPALTAGTAWASAMMQPSSTNTADNTQSSQSVEQAKVEPKVEKKTVTVTEEVAFAVNRTNDATLTQGKEVERQAGKPGVKTITYEVTYTNGQETARVKTKEEVTVPPTPTVIAVGTKVAVAPRQAVRPRPVPAPQPVSNCDANYSPCVPIASDVDCAGGRGNGPAYVAGPVRVIGSDIYDLDRDGDGYGCD